MSTGGASSDARSGSASAPGGGSSGSGSGSASGSAAGRAARSRRTAPIVFVGAAFAACRRLLGDGPGGSSDRLLQSLDAIRERLQRRSGVAPAEPDECDLEDEPGVGGVGAPHVDDRLTERLEGAHEQAGTGLLAEAGEQCDLVVRELDAHAPLRRREQEGVARRREEVLGDPPWIEPGIEELTGGHEHAGRVLVRDRVEDGHAPVEARPTEQRGDLVHIECPVCDGLVEQGQRVPHGTGGGAGEDLERAGVGSDTFLLAHPREMTDDLVERQQRELVVLGA